MRRSLLLIALAAACTDRPIGEGTDATTSSTSTTASATTDVPTTTGDTGSTTDAPEPCFEVSHHHDNLPPTWMATCEGPALCTGDEPLRFVTSTAELLEPGSVEVDDLERARCMVAAVRDRLPGQLDWQMWGDVELVRVLSLEILGDTAIARRQRPSTLDLPAPDNVHEELFHLRPPEFFAACAEGDALAVWLCLVDAVEPTCLPGPLTCRD